MASEGITKLDIEVLAEDSSIQELDRITRQLLSDLRDVHLEPAELKKLLSRVDGGPRK